MIDEKTKAIIQKCIDEKWHPIVNGSGIDHGCENCSLCKNFTCDNCLFLNACCETSYYDWDLYQEKNGYELEYGNGYKVFDEKSKQLAINVLNDLKALLK
jgi:hypothetical protein